MDSLAQLQKDIISCNKCQRLRSVTPLPLSHIAWSDSPKVMTIGRNPGLENKYDHISEEELTEYYHEKWLKCRYGTYLQNVFTEDFIRDYIFACNICKCSTPKNSNLMEAEINYCLPYLHRQIAIVKPRIILIFGSEAANILLDSRIEYLKPTKGNDTITIVCRHPAYFLYSHSEKSKEQKEEQAKALYSVKKFVENSV